MNQRTDAERVGGSGDVISPVRGSVAFKTLPKEVQANLLKLQNTDGDFLRLGTAVVVAKVIWLFLPVVGLALFLAAFEFSVFNLRTIIAISIGTSAFVIWIVYLLWGILKAFLSPTKNRIYLTRTQVIETTSGSVRYRDLIDAADISVNRYWNDMGHRSSLLVSFQDGDRYEFTFEISGIERQLAETQKWQEIGTAWKKEAVDTAGRGDAAYFERLDAIPRSAAGSLSTRTHSN